MIIKRVDILFAMSAEEEPMAVVRDALDHELFSVWSGAEASDLYHSLTRGDMRIDYNEMSGVKRET